MRHPIAVAILLPLVMAHGSGCRQGTGMVAGATRNFEGVDFILYRLNGDRYPSEPVVEGMELLHGWEVLERCPVDDPAVRAELFEAFEAGQDEAREADSPPVDCYQPRHAIRIVDGDVATDHLICFQCRNFETWTGDEQTGGGALSESPRAVFDARLADCPAIR